MQHRGAFAEYLYLLCYPNNPIKFPSKAALLWQFHVAGNNNKTWLCLYVKCLIFCPILTKFFIKFLNIKFKTNSLSGSHADTFGHSHTNGRTNTTKLIGAFHVLLMSLTMTISERDAHSWHVNVKNIHEEMPHLLIPESNSFHPKVGKSVILLPGTKVNCRSNEHLFFPRVFLVPENIFQLEFITWKVFAVFNI